MSLPVFVSVHDVMPQTLEAVERTLKELEGIPPSHVQLLVVPGLDWKPDELALLKSWNDQGWNFCGHGRVHECSRIGSLKHRLHSTLISRNVAEHLELDAEGIAKLIQDCFDWFPANAFREPDWYVPPAWAMGCIARDRLDQLPFRFYEFQTGVYDSGSGRFLRIPLLGYEADSLFRKGFLSLFNLANRTAARARRMPIRLSIHPFDLDYRLARSLKAIVAKLAAEEAGEYLTAVKASAYFG